MGREVGQEKGMLEDLGEESVPLKMGWESCMAAMRDAGDAGVLGAAVKVRQARSRGEGRRETSLGGCGSRVERGGRLA